MRASTYGWEPVRQRWDTYWAEAIEPRFFLLRQLRLAGPAMVALLAVVNIVLGLLPVAFVIATGVLVGRVPAAVSGGLDSPAWDALVAAFLGATAAFFALQLLAPVQLALGAVVKHRVDGHFHNRLIAVSLRSTGIGSLEDQDNLASLGQAAESLGTDFRTPGDASSGFLALIARYTRLLGFGVVIGVVATWGAALALCTATMIFRYGQRGGLRMYMRIWPLLLPHRRAMSYFYDVGVGASSAKEIRVFGLSLWLIGRYRASARAALVPLWQERRRVAQRRYLWFTAAGLVLSCTVLAVMLRSAAAGDLTLTQLTLALQAAVGIILLGEFYHEADAATEFGMQAARALDDFEGRIDEHADQDVSAAATADAAGLPTQGIQFADVSFSYAGGDRPVLDGLALTLKAGQCTAIVGLNGAGKTTLVKLLARLYEPTAGAVLVDGRDVREFAVDSWRRQIGVIFQDFNRYELSVADNIIFGAIERPVDDQVVRRAATNAGLDAALAALPRGLDTMLARQFDDGADLSGGQWQRVAIARALYAVDAGARVLVLDEPTAALDVRAEAEFFAAFAERTRGLTTLLISHRFSSVRHADRIVVLEHGRVVEDGTHESLVAGSGRYAELFHLQAERFAAGLDAEDALEDLVPATPPGASR